MPTLKGLQDQGRHLINELDALVKDSRPWSEKKAEIDAKKANVEALVVAYKAQKAVDNSPLDGLDGVHGVHDINGSRSLKGFHAGIVSQGHQPMLPPQLNLTDDDTKELYEAAVSHKSLSVTSKAATTTSSVPQALITTYQTTPIPFRREPLRVLSLIPTYSTSTPSVTWYTATGTTGAAAVNEGETKPQSTLAYSPVTGTVTKLAHWAEFTDETINDFPAFLNLIGQDMFAGIVQVENLELLNATVTGAHKFAGLLNTSGVLVGTAVPATPSQTDRLDAIGAAMDSLATGPAFASPDGIVMHPSTWGTIKRNKDSQNRYLLSDPGTATDPRIWGVPVVLTTQIAAGTVLIGDFAGSTAAYVRQNIAVDTSNQGENQFKNNTTLIRAEERLLLTVPRPSGLIKVTGF